MAGTLRRLTVNGLSHNLRIRQKLSQLDWTQPAPSGQFVSDFSILGQPVCDLPYKAGEVDAPERCRHLAGEVSLYFKEGIVEGTLRSVPKQGCSWSVATRASACVAG